MQRQGEYLVGDQPTIKCTFRDRAEVATDPTTVTFTMKEPDGTKTTYTYGTDTELRNDATGVYQTEWPITKEGAHYFEFRGTGTVAAVQDATFAARAPRTT